MTSCTLHLLLLATATAAAAAATAAATNNAPGLSGSAPSARVPHRKPPMGFSSWNHFGAHYL